MPKLCERFLAILFYSDLHGVRVVLGLSELLWAMTLLWPGIRLVALRIPGCPK